ncbi:glycosyltransferase family 39 protein [Candidatus Gottesmanbacteria bacterium]|nr:glycosyltransferase family 39 protein [Candidatus Gottesmanbacteria bacterium]
MKMKFLAILLVLFGFLLRVWRSEELAGFDFDGERAAFWIRDLILFHKISLIGQEISLGGIFIGPFFYFFLTPFYYFWKMDPVAASIGVSLVSIFTMILIYKVGTRLFGQKTGLLALFLYAVSFRLNYYDRTTAPSNLIMICSLTVLYILTGEITRFRGLLLGAVLGLTFSVHPTAVLLLPIVLTFFLWNKKKFSGKILITVLGLMLFIWPLIIFDLRHEFIGDIGSKIIGG